ncbi:serine protease [Pendulispora rubella]|uniref:Serine protease n=1 Tax=Pendulispora rubella TaxID=2741070 RepID=A0ABZ2KVU0_9BACT
MKKLIAIAAVPALFLVACSSADQTATNEADSPAAPQVDEGNGTLDHPDFLRKVADPTNYKVTREPAEHRGSSVLSTCGSTDDSVYVNDYTGNLGVSTAYVNAHKNPVGAMESSASDASSAKYCSGTLIANDLFLTASHCIDSSTVANDYIAFNYERAKGSTTVLTQTHVKITAIVEDGLGGLDYAIVRLQGSPGTTFGTTPANATEVAAGGTLAIIQHPARLPKKIEAGTKTGNSGDYHTYGNIDTQGGSSGSGILNASGQVVGVHTNGGCTSSGGTNSGVRMSRIAAASNIL